VGWALGYLAIIRRRQGDNARAVALLEESLMEFRELGDKFGIGCRLANLANAVRIQGDDRRAECLYRESLLVRRALLDKPGVADCFEGMAMTIAEEQRERAVCLLGAAYALREAIGVPVDVGMRPDKDHTIATAQAMLEVRTFAAAWAEGQALPLEAVIALALAEPAQPGT
jgi:tetratricopeptide repeat protein